MKVRRHILFEEADWELLNELKEKHQLNSVGSVIEYLINNYRQSSTGITQAQLTAEIVKAELEEFYNTLRIRTGYTDKHTKLILHMLNDIVINQGWDLPSEGVSHSIEETPSLLFQDAQEHFNARMKKYNEQQQLKVARRKGVVNE